jgi:hypothetical protein
MLIHLLLPPCTVTYLFSSTKPLLTTVSIPSTSLSSSNTGILTNYSFLHSQKIS